MPYSIIDMTEDDRKAAAVREIIRQDFANEFPQIMEWFSDLIEGEFVVDKYGNPYVTVYRKDTLTQIAEYDLT